MLYKPDWEKVKERMLAWWECELVDRVVMQVLVLDNQESAFGWNWLNSFNNRHEPERTREAFERYCRESFLGAEFFPNLWINLGPGVPAAYLGCTPQADNDTIWFSPPERDLTWDELTTLELDPDNSWWKLTKELTGLAVEWADGKYFAGLPDLNSIHDVLCHLHGTQNLLIDLIDRPDEVKQALDRLNDIWLTCYDELTGILQPAMEGSAGWMNVWSPGRGNDVQCDFSAMLGPEMFEEFVLPYIEIQCRFLDHSIFHLDGPECIPHLEMLLDIPELDGIQWVPGAGNAPVGSPEWLPLYRRIQEKGKCLVLQGMDKGDVEGVMRELSSRGLLIETKCESVEEAREMLRKAEKWTRD